MIEFIIKRNGAREKFHEEKIERAVWNAVKSVGGNDKEKFDVLLHEILKNIKKEKKKEMSVEEIQDIIERTLIKRGHDKVAKSYILYRHQHESLRNFKNIVEDTAVIDNYLNQADWRVKENSNSRYSLSGLNHNIAQKVSSTYWLNKVFAPEVAKYHFEGDLHIHDLGSLSTYCQGWDLRDLLLTGFGGVESKIESAPPKHFRSALGQIVNFLFTTQNEFSGAQAFANFDTYLAPFIRFDGLTEKEVKQALQEFVFNMNVTTRSGGQSTFSNITLDLTPPKHMENLPVIIGGKIQNVNYKDFQPEIDLFNRILFEVYLEGDKNGKVFTFPIPTINIDKNFDWNNPNHKIIWDATAKYGIPYFGNYINSDMSPEDTVSMCCRLRLEKKTLNKRGGGLFAANPLTGSVGVVTINMPRIGYLAHSERDYFNRLDELMDASATILRQKRKFVEKWTEQGLFPFTKFYMRHIKQNTGQYWTNHFNTIGLNGMNESCENFLGKDILSKEGKAFTIKVMNHMKNRLEQYKAEDGQEYNLEATPAEGVTRRFAAQDKKKYADIIVANNENYEKYKAAPYYTNSTQVKVDSKKNLFNILDNQNDIQTIYNGGCIEKGNDILTNKGLMKIEDLVYNFKKLKNLKVLSYNKEKNVSEWDDVIDAMKIDVSKKDKIKIIGEFGLDIVTSNWHPFFVYDKKTKKIIEKRADELLKNDYILKTSTNLYKNKSSKINNDLMWLLGFYIGDGSMSTYYDNRGNNNIKKEKIRFFSTNDKTINKIINVLNNNFNSNISKSHIDKRTKNLKILPTSKENIINFFKLCGFKPGSKTYNVRVSNYIKNNFNKNNVFHFISGLLDSDGHINKKQGTGEYYTVSENLKNDLKEIFSIAGIPFSLRKRQPKKINEVLIYIFQIPSYYLTQEKNNLNLTKDKNYIKTQKSNRNTRFLPVTRVKSINKHNVKDNMFYDLTTKNNHNYLAGNDCMVFVHNTVFHIFLGEHKANGESVKNLIKKIFTNYSIPYVSITPTFSVCPLHGYISGNHKFCPKCLTAGDILPKK